jgi:hypothetical protein
MNTLTLSPDGPIIAKESDANDIIGEAFGIEGAELIVIPVERLSPEFFRLASGLAGAVLQKFTNYHFRVAIVGDISAYVEKSAPLRDFVRESNRGGAVRFVGSVGEL